MAFVGHANLALNSQRNPRSALHQGKASQTPTGDSCVFVSKHLNRKISAAAGITLIPHSDTRKPRRLCRCGNRRQSLHAAPAKRLETSTTQRL